MHVAAPHPHEEARLAALEGLELLDTGPDPMWDRLVKIAATVCDVPIALVSVVAAERQWFKARLGLDAEETHRDMAFCAHAIHGDGLLVVPDAMDDERFAGNPLVTGDPSIRFYAGAPVRMPDGLPMGTVCVIDRKPKQLDASQEEALRLLASQAEDLLALRSAFIRIRRAVMDPEDVGQKIVNHAAHHLRTPLVPIVTRLEVLDRSLGDRPDLQKIVRDAKRDIERARTAVESAIDLAKVQHMPPKADGS